MSRPEYAQKYNIFIVTLNEIKLSKILIKINNFTYIVDLDVDVN